MGFYRQKLTQALRIGLAIPPRRALRGQMEAEVDLGQGGEGWQRAFLPLPTPGSARKSLRERARARESERERARGKEKVSERESERERERESEKHRREGGTLHPKTTTLNSERQTNFKAS